MVDVLIDDVNSVWTESVPVTVPFSVWNWLDDIWLVEILAVDI